MEGLKVSFLLKASVLQSKAALMLCFPPLLLILLLAFSAPLESTLMPTIWRALPGPLEEPALAFLLLNCVTLTIFASSKLGSEKRGHGEEGQLQGQVAVKLTEKGDGKGDDVVETVIGISLYLDTPVENAHQNGDDDVAESVVRPSLYLHTPLEIGHGFSKNKGRNFLIRRSWSLNASSEYKTKHEEVKLNPVEEKKPIRSRGRLGSRRISKVGLHPSKPLSTELQKKELRSGSLTSSHAADSEGTHHAEKPALKDDNCDKTVDEKGCSGGAGSVTDQEPRQASDRDRAPAPAPAPAAGETAHPSMDEVWAAIMSSKKGDDRLASCCMQAKSRRKKPNSKTVKQPQPAAATSTATQCTAAVLVAPPAAASAATNSPGSAGKVANSAKKARAAAAKKHVADWNGRSELEELNHRADEFIGRFNRQMRLQREESLQQRQKRAGRRACNYAVQYSHQAHGPGLRVPARGLLVG